MAYVDDYLNAVKRVAAAPRELILNLEEVARGALQNSTFSGVDKDPRVRYYEHILLSIESLRLEEAWVPACPLTHEASSLSRQQSLSISISPTASGRYSASRRAERRDSLASGFRFPSPTELGTSVASSTASSASLSTASTKCSISSTVYTSTTRSKSEKQRDIMYDHSLLTDDEVDAIEEIRTAAKAVEDAAEEVRTAEKALAAAQKGGKDKKVEQATHLLEEHRAAHTKANDALVALMAKHIPPIYVKQRQQYTHMCTCVARVLDPTDVFLDLPPLSERAPSSVDGCTPSPSVSATSPSGGAAQPSAVLGGRCPSTASDSRPIMDVLKTRSDPLGNQVLGPWVRFRYFDLLCSSAEMVTTGVGLLLDYYRSLGRKSGYTFPRQITEDMEVIAHRMGLGKSEDIRAKYRSFMNRAHVYCKLIETYNFATKRVTHYRARLEKAIRKKKSADKIDHVQKKLDRAEEAQQAALQDFMDLDFNDVLEVYDSIFHLIHTKVNEFASLLRDES